MTKKYSKVYIEITNLCNLCCKFCPQTKRIPQKMSIMNFKSVIDKINLLTDYVYFHVLGEPTSHENLSELVQIANEKNKKITITTNGTNLGSLTTILKTQPIYKVNISLQALGANEGIDIASYMKEVIEFAVQASERGTLVVLRLWNGGGETHENIEIISILKNAFVGIDFYEKPNIKLKNRIFLEKANEFQWRCDDVNQALFCYGLRDQFAILVDGTVVPCCIDSEGEIPLGNIFTENINDILQNERAIGIFDGFSNKIAVEKRCQHCGFARRFINKN